MEDQISLNVMRDAAQPALVAEIASASALIEAAQRLRYDVFVREMGAEGDHASRLDHDRYDPVADHLILRDLNRPQKDQIVGAYRMLSQAAADSLGGFYTETEFDLMPLRRSGRKILELGRSCLHPDYRGGTSLMVMWLAIASYVRAQQVDLLVGVASFAGTDVGRLAEPLSLLHHRHLAPQGLRPKSRQSDQPDLLSPDKIDRVAAMRQTPALIKGYLRLGGMIGQGVFVDRTFNTTDVCMILDTANLTEHGKHYAQ